MEVKGEAWMDHEISSSQLGEGLAGWDWTYMQLNDGTEVKAYRLRKEDGSSDRGPRSIGLIKRETLSRCMPTNFRGLRRANGRVRKRLLLIQPLSRFLLIIQTGEK